MDWLRAVLPTFAAFAGTPLAGVAAAFIGKRIGVEQATVEAIQEHLTAASPEQLVEVKRVDADLQKFMAELGIEPERIAAADRASARDREVKTGDVWTPRVLATVVSLGFFGVLGWLLVMGKPAEGGDAVLLMLGALGAAWTAIVQYYFGSSAGSRDKTIAGQFSSKRRTDPA